MEFWRFETKNFAVIFTAEDEFDMDWSWDEDGEAQEMVSRGIWHVFCAKVSVEYQGQEIGTDYLGCCVYDDPANFIDHRGMNAGGYGSYFSDMVREAIKEARAHMLEDRPYIRSVAA